MSSQKEIQLQAQVEVLEKQLSEAKALLKESVRTTFLSDASHYSNYEKIHIWLTENQ